MAVSAASDMSDQTDAFLNPNLVPPAAAAAPLYAVNVTQRLRFLPDCPPAEDKTISESPLVSGVCTVRLQLKASGLLIRQTTPKEQRCLP